MPGRSPQPAHQGVLAQRQRQRDRQQHQRHSEAVGDERRQSAEQAGLGEGSRHQRQEDGQGAGQRGHRVGDAEEEYRPVAVLLGNPTHGGEAEVQVLAPQQHRAEDHQAHAHHQCQPRDEIGEGTQAGSDQQTGQPEDNQKAGRDYPTHRQRPGQRGGPPPRLVRI